MGGSYFVGIKGESHYQDAIRPDCVGKPVALMHEPDNPYDPNAIRVDSHRGETMGYLPRDGWLTRALLKQKRFVRAKVKSVDHAPGSDNRAVVLEVSVEREDDGGGGVQDVGERITAFGRALTQLGCGCLGLGVIVFVVALLFA